MDALPIRWCPMEEGFTCPCLHPRARNPVSVRSALSRPHSGGARVRPVKPDRGHLLWSKPDRPSIHQSVPLSGAWSRGWALCPVHGSSGALRPPIHQSVPLSGAWSRRWALCPVPGSSGALSICVGLAGLPSIRLGWAGATSFRRDPTDGPSSRHTLTAPPSDSVRLTAPPSDLVGPKLPQGSIGQALSAGRFVRWTKSGA